MRQKAAQGMRATTPTKLGVLFMGRKRLGFDPEWGEKISRDVRSSMEAGVYETFYPETVVDDASLRRAIKACKTEECEVLLVLQPTMGDGRLVPVMHQIWGGALVLWATPEKPNGDMISSNSLVGTHVFAATLRQLGRPFELVYGHPDDARTRGELDRAVSLIAASQRLSASKVGLIGYHAPGFIDLDPDPSELNKNLGVQMHHFGLQEFIEATEDVSAGDVAADVERVRELGIPFEDVQAQDLSTNSRYYLALQRLAEEESLDALALRCWPELPNLVGQWPYLAMVRLSSEGYPNAMEGDVDGAISCLIGELLDFGSGYLSDWLEHDAETITLWHPGNASLNLSESVGNEYGPRLAKHFNVPKPMVVNASLQANREITLFRLWRCDGRYRIMAEDARTLAPRRPLLGTNGLAHIPGRDVYDWFEDLCHEGMPHHLAVFPGHHSDLLRRFARQTGIEWVS